MTHEQLSSDHPDNPDPVERPTLLVFDVNETLSDMAPLADRFVDVGTPEHLAKLWFAELLRDGFAVTVAGDPLASIRRTRSGSLAAIARKPASTAA